MAERRIDLGLVLPALTGAILVIALGFILFGSAGRDDSYITYWAAQSLSEHGAILNYNGDPIEQSSSLLHVVVLGALHRLTGIPFATLGPLFSLLCGVLVVVSVVAIARPVSTRLAWAAGLGCACNPFLVYWSSAGLETPLAALATLHVAHWGARAMADPRGQHAVRFAISATALVLVRPEGVALLGCWAGLVGSLRIVRLRRFDRGLVRLASGVGVGIGVFMLTALWRLHRSDMIFPLPVTAKFGWEWHRLLDGLSYLNEHLVTASFVAMVAIAMGCLVVRRGRSDQPEQPLPFGSYLAATGAQLVFVTMSGGDWMEAGRFLVPIVATLTLASLAGLWALGTTAALRSALVGVLAISLAADALVLTAKHSTGFSFGSGDDHIARVLADAKLDADDYSYFERYNRMHLREIPTIEEVVEVVDELRAELGRPVVVMTMQMGMVAYYTNGAHPGRIRWVDRMGLATEDVSRCPLLDRLPRTPYGIEMRYQHFFRHFDSLHEHCDIPTPDLIYDVSGARSVRNNGFEIVYSQSGRSRLGAHCPERRSCRSSTSPFAETCLCACPSAGTGRSGSAGLRCCDRFRGSCRGSSRPNRGLVAAQYWHADRCDCPQISG